MTTTAPMTSLRKNAEFIGPDGRTHYRVTRPASAHPHGWVEVRNLSMTAAEARAAIKRGDPEPGCDPRDGFFSYSVPVDVQVIRH